MCDCDVGIGFYDSRAHVAKKPHRCKECEALIAPGTKYHYKVGVVLEGLYSKRFWSVKLCESCERDWDALTDIEWKRVGTGAGCVCYGELRKRIGEAEADGWLTDGTGLEMYLRWFTPDPEEIELEPRLCPGGVHPSEAWRLSELPFAEPARTRA